MKLKKLAIGFLVAVIFSNDVFAKNDDLALPDSTVYAGLTCEQLLEADPLGVIDKRVHGAGIYRLMKFGKLMAFAFKYRKIMAAIMRLPDQTHLGLANAEQITKSAALLNVTEQDLLKYYQEGTILKLWLGKNIDLRELQRDGKNLIRENLGEPIADRSVLTGAYTTKLVFFTGEKCTWCDYVKPTFALLSPFLKDDADIYYAEDPDFRKSEGVDFMPMLVAYRGETRIYSQAYFSSTKKLFARIVLMFDLARHLDLTSSISPADHRKRKRKFVLNLDGELTALSEDERPSLENLK